MQLKAFISLCGAAVLMSGPAQAQLALTPAGVADGFTLTTFVSGYSPAAYGPLAQGILPDGNVITGSALIGNVGMGTIYIFKDADNQTLSSALSAAPYTFTTGNPQYAMATAGGQVYGAQAFGGIYEHFDNSGAHTPVAGLPSTLRSDLGMWGDLANGHIVSSSNEGIVDINPLNGAVRVIVASPNCCDGVTVSPDGKTVYAESGGNILAFDYASGALLNTFPGGGHGPDGTGVISGGAMRAVIESAGIKDILTKSHGTNNPINTVRATLAALQELRTAQQVADLRSKEVEQIVGRRLANAYRRADGNEPAAAVATAEAQ